jgi:hypothetical protein
MAKTPATENPRNFPIVAVRWIDSSAPTEGGWQTIENLENLKEDPLMCFSVGYLIDMNDFRIVLCNSYHESGKSIGTMGLISIPGVAIDSLEYIYEPPEDREDPDGVT